MTKRKITTHDRFVAASKLLGGDIDRWQAAAGAKLGISRGHMHHLVTGARPITREMILKIVAATRADATLHRDLANRLEATFADLPLSDLLAMPTMSKDEYERQADEAMDIINDMTGGAGDEGEQS